ncbi:hypothetical protein A3C17_04255 [Candidatus Uhrbacteria bacterium RIFCSPHIGHO2_02_FULL_53_13]|uniref:Uncharacterized protein n=2 Tax=Candidatus Uhriibacteriota TaxID=1752732 RepID=A0A1F7TY64_9BACT|nr:MAG: hypothetical protein A3C17_04255 [Candidatus Uhrbacteria bacterium RIFCSPHIGHO2_02_FULL_53_13]OGL89629.1 MAG: hypothetical protein A3I45_04740 [Candidatus Uhrbacteria bacterium RIFCSPLOWO2_02_FULL_53_10]
MANDSTIGKRIFTLAVVAMTILWTVGATALAPLSASAVSAGDLIRGTSFSTVYYYGSNGMRYTFPNEKTYFSWYSDFSGVSTISDSELAAIPLGGNVAYRPGSYWVKIQSNPKVYAVSTDGTIRWIESPEVAAALYGSANWGSFVQDVPDSFFSDYTEGVSLASAANLYDGALVSDGSNTFLIWGGKRRQVSSAGMAANRLQSKHVMNTTVAVSAIAAGSDLNAKSNEVADTAQILEGDGSSSVTPAGGLSLSTASDTPAGATLPQGANGVNVLKIRASASGGDVELDDLVLALGGVGATANISNVYLYEGSQRLTEGRSANSSTRQVTFSNLNFKVLNGQSRNLWVSVETSTSATAADTMSFSVVSANGAAVSGVQGNTFSFSGNSVGTVTITKTGTITNPSLGQQNAVIGKFRVTAGTENAEIQRLRLKINNASDHSAFSLYQGADKVADGVYASGDYVDFAFTAPYTVAEGNSRNFDVKAKIGGQAAENISIAMDRDTDLVAVGGDFGFNQSVTRSGYDGGAAAATEDDANTCFTSSAATTNDCSFSTIQGGDVTFAFNGPPAGDVHSNSQDVILFSFSVTSAQNVTVKDLDFIVYGEDNGLANAFVPGDDTTLDSDGLVNTNGEGNLKDLKVRHSNGSGVLLSPLELDCVANTTACGSDGTRDGAQTIDFTDDFTLTAGTTYDLELTADIDNDVTADTEFGATLDVSGLTIEDSNGDNLTLGTDIIPSGDLIGNNRTARSAALTVALASSPVSTTVVQGTSNVNVAAFTMTAGVGSDVTVSSATVSAYADEGGTTTGTLGGETGAQVEDFISSCSIYDGDGALLDGPAAASNSGANFVFDDMLWTVPAGTVEVMSVYCNLANPSDTDTDVFSWGLNDVSADMVASDEDGNSVTATGDAVNHGGTALGTTVGTTTGVASVAISIASAGTLAYAPDPGSPNADILVAGTSGNVVSKFKFTATNESMLVTRLTVSEEAAEDDNFGTNATTYTNNVASVAVSYPDSNGATATATAFMSGNEAKFDGLDFLVPANSPKVVTVSVSVPGSNRDSGGSAQSGEDLLVELFLDATNDDNFRAVGQGSGSVLDDDDPTSSNTGLSAFVIHETKPTISLASGSPSGAKVPGLDEVLRFTVAASSNEDVVVDEAIFKMVSTDNNGATAAGSDWNECSSAVSGNSVDADFSLYDYTDLGTELDTSSSAWNLLSSTGANCEATADTSIAFVQLELVAADDLVIAAGTTKTFSLWFDSTGASATNDDSVRFDIPADPIASAYIDSGAFDVNGAVTGEDTTTLTIDTGSSRPLHGDVVCLSSGTCASTDEIVLVTNIDDDTATALYVSRGYLGRNRGGSGATVADNTELDYLPSSLVWYDDGSTTDDTDAFEDEVSGSYLVDNLPLIGGTIIF